MTPDAALDNFAFFVDLRLMGADARRRLRLTLLRHPDVAAQPMGMAESILADARERAELRRATEPRVAGTIMHYARLKAERVLAGGARLQFGRDSRDLDGNPRPTMRRACPRCRSDFQSTGPGNRLCGDCQVKAADASPYAV